MKYAKEILVFCILASGVLAFSDEDPDIQNKLASALSNYESSSGNAFNSKGNFIIRDEHKTIYRSSVLKCKIVKDDKRYGIQNIKKVVQESDNNGILVIEYTKANCYPKTYSGPICNTYGPYIKCVIATAKGELCLAKCEAIKKPQPRSFGQQIDFADSAAWF